MKNPLRIAIALAACLICHASALAAITATSGNFHATASSSFSGSTIPPASGSATNNPPDVPFVAPSTSQLVNAPSIDYASGGYISHAATVAGTQITLSFSGRGVLASGQLGPRFGSGSGGDASGFLNFTTDSMQFYTASLPYIPYYCTGDVSLFNSSNALLLKLDSSIISNSTPVTLLLGSGNYSLKWSAHAQGAVGTSGTRSWDYTFAQATPEPCTSLLACAASLSLLRRRRRSQL